MAQTRAAGKALRSVFAFVAVLAGYSATPSEEMPSNANQKPETVIKKAPVNATKKQADLISEAGKGYTLTDKQVKEFVVWYRKGNKLTFQEAEELIANFGDELDKWIAETSGEQSG